MTPAEALLAELDLVVELARAFWPRGRLSRVLAAIRRDVQEGTLTAAAGREWAESILAATMRAAESGRQGALIGP